MKLSKELMLLSVISIVFLAGCAGRGGEAPTGAGVIITSFVPDVQSVDAGSTVSFIVNLKNVGGKTSGVGKALFFGLSNDWTLDPATGLKNVPTLAPADSSLGLPGEETSIDFSATIAGTAAKNADVTYDASVRVMYGYTTTVDTLLRFVKSDFLRTAPNTPKGIQSSTATAGPLLVTAAARTPTLSAASTTGRVQFEIQNIGPGRVITDVPTDGIVPATSLDIIKTIEVTGVGGGGKCAGTPESGGKVTLSNQRLAGGKSKVISCDIAVPDLVNFKDSALKVTLTYSYFVDSTTTITVLKALE